MSQQDLDRVRDTVRESYAKVARGADDAEKIGGCAPSSGCCGTGEEGASVVDVAKGLGYGDADLDGIPEGANLGLGCGNPGLFASLAPGETVLDLGSGAGFDCFVAANRVGPEGRVIGVDMTSEMLARARANADKGGFANVEFRLGEIEHLPVADRSVDAILSNCVVNLSPDKAQVFREAFRVLRPGGRVAISDVVATAELPPEIKADQRLLAGCIAGAASIPELERWMAEAGFVDVSVRPWDESRAFIGQWAPGRKVEDLVVSAVIQARRPGGCCG
ncbi:MAG: arsenite methyltransferase [Planctomycetota bacterium]